MRLVRCPKCKRSFVVEPDFMPHRIVMQIDLDRTHQVTFAFHREEMSTTLGWGAFLYSVEDGNPVENSSEGVLKLVSVAKTLQPKLNVILLALPDDITEAAHIIHQTFLQLYWVAQPEEDEPPPNTSICIHHYVAIDHEMYPCHLELHKDGFWIHNPIVQNTLSNVRLFGRTWKVKFVWPSLDTEV
mgnify:CR=1 FL=1